MAEYIERDDVLALETFMVDPDGFEHSCVLSVDVRSVAAADVVEVVRCDKCKHFRRNLENDTYCNCIGGLSDPEEHDFCSYGERVDTTENSKKLASHSKGR